MISYQIKTDGRFFCIFSSLALIHQPRNIFIPATCYSDTIVFLDKPGWTTFHHLGPSHCSSPSSWMEELVFFKLNYPSKGKKCTQSSQVDGLVSFPLSPPPQAATILTLLETLVIQDGLNFQLFLIILLGGRVRVFSPCNTSLNIRSKCFIDICLQLI